MDERLAIFLVRTVADMSVACGLSVGDMVAVGDLSDEMYCRLVDAKGRADKLLKTIREEEEEKHPPGWSTHDGEAMG